VGDLDATRQIFPGCKVCATARPAVNGTRDIEVVPVFSQKPAKQLICASFDQIGYFLDFVDRRKQFQRELLYLALHLFEVDQAPGIGGVTRVEGFLDTSQYNMKVSKGGPGTVSRRNRVAQLDITFPVVNFNQLR
jgi:hypothetical protein